MAVAVFKHQHLQGLALEDLLASQHVWAAALLHQLWLVLHQTPTDLLDFGVRLTTDLLEVHQFDRKTFALFVMGKIDLTKGALSYLFGYTIFPDLNASGKSFSILQVVSVVEVQLPDLGLSALLHTNTYYYMNAARIY